MIDTYPDVSIKNAERDRRSVARTVETKIRSGAQTVDKQLKKSLRSGAFKGALAHFLLHEWSKQEYAERLEKGRLFVTAGDKCFMLKANDDQTEVLKAEVSQLSCSQEEADTRMLRHAAHAADHGAPAKLMHS